MASTSPWRLSRKPNTAHSAICNPSTFNSLHCFIHRRRRARLTTSSLKDSQSSSSSSSSSSSFSCTPITPKRRPIKSVQLPVLPDNKKPTTFGHNGATKVPTLSLKSLFGRRSLWRRILFASRKVRGIILLNVLTVVYASNIPVVKEVEAIMDPATFAAVRFVVSAIPFIPFVVRARGDVQTRNAGIELGFWVSLGYLMQSLGLLTSDAGRASFLSMFTVIVVPLLDGMLGATVPAHTWFGALMSILGVAMLESSGSPPSVCIVALFSTIWYFVGGSFGAIQECDLSSGMWTMLWDWMVAFPWIPAFYTGIISTGLCLWIEMDAMRDVSATETAIIYGLEPVWGAGFAWFLLGERWSSLGWIGAALVLGQVLGLIICYLTIFIFHEIKTPGILRELSFSCFPDAAMQGVKCGVKLEHSGSLTVQIFGSSSPNKSREEERNEKDDHLLVPDKESGYSTSPVVAKLELQTEIKSSPDRIFDIYKNKTSLMPKISPDKLKSIEVLEGDGKSVGSVRLWTYVMGGAVIAKDKIVAIDEEKGSMTFDLIGGEVTNYYKSFKATIEATSEAQRIW
ncbi:MLP-like protein 43 [Vitis vinifera]|uniref:MLP-like protein 43 n=1 Tax=Vitis vinifera TaxID=29760 RepID=A0A438C192_VITVI|nr:MLP-like protein 43 [Vitis vinifera]